MTLTKRPLVDPKCFELAEHFVERDTSVTEKQRQDIIWDVADQIQKAIEGTLGEYNKGTCSVCRREQEYGYHEHPCE